MRDLKITNDSGLAIGTRMTAGDGGADFSRCIEEMHVHFVPGRVVQAECRIALVRVDTPVKASFYVPDPTKDGAPMREVRSITFADGETVEF